MNNLNSKEFNCCGCGVCSEICPQNAIELKDDEEGFLKYGINIDKCINCGLCIKKCPQINYKQQKLKNNSRVYAAYVKDNTIILNSTSGGMFRIIAEKISLYNKYAIFGCILDDNNVARHICIEDIKNIEPLLGSKYVQSDTRDIFHKVKQKIDLGYKVLFSGTPCQISALNSYLDEKEYKNLYTIDLICHGVPSPLLFKKYLEWLETKYNGKIKRYQFRNKDRKSWELLCSFDVNKKRYYSNNNLDPYFNSFINGDTYRESCYDCKYANRNRVSDITLGDFWGIEEIYPTFFNKLGNSIVMVNTKKGEELFKLIKNDISYIESNFEIASQKNHNLKHPSERNKIRDSVYQGIKEKEFNDIIKENLKFKSSLKDFIKSKISNSLKYKIKKYFRRK